MRKFGRRTKIVATVGPASSSIEMLGHLIDAGVDLFRLNFSHGRNEEKAETIKAIRELSELKGRQIGILGDLQGPKIRTGRMENGAIPLIKGERLSITTRDLLGRPGLISTVYKALPHDVQPGSRILMDDGLIELKVASIEDDTVHCTVIEGGTLKDLKGINLPGVNVSSPALTEKDRVDLEFCLQAKVDYIALSFVRTAADIEEVKRIIFEHDMYLPVIAKIEKPEALRNFKSILKVTDAVMVARGDLGVEINAEKVPLFQKKIIRACNEAGKPVITATQMLESMISHPRPTRAETSDVANAIIDGTDAVMLSGETASGAFPVEAVKAMCKVAVDVERSELWRISHRPDGISNNISRAVAQAACHAAASLNARCIAVLTQSGSTAALISKFRPQLPIIAFTPFPEIQRKLSLYWGVNSCVVGRLTGTDEQINAVEDTLLAAGFRKGDVIIITMGVPIEARGSTNLLKVHKLGAKGFYEIF
ncbi:pyruvate kinase [Geobacter pelophilus]|uniref:Pyruvate kinase n=1 Tax=Geoanaerobacter pelophilus TaxID=60036 RepID=A0AAW4L1H4_9BACT|nr:pyruvate kinase [Geoanaerobacter pelophilus]MBT0664816.1 pyruvate kinase [Geoanaerobacter pelophilus]